MPKTLLAYICPYCKTILGLYDKRIKIPDRPKSSLDGALMLAVMDLTSEGFTTEQMAAACNVLKPFAEQLIKQRGGGRNRVRRDADPNQNV